MKLSTFTLFPVAVLAQSGIVFVHTARFSGSGCPTSVTASPLPSATFTPDNRATEINFPNFNVDLSKPGQNNKNCDVVLSVDWPIAACTRATVNAALVGESRDSSNPNITPTVIRRYDFHSAGEYNPPFYAGDVRTRVMQDYVLPDTFTVTRRNAIAGQNIAELTFRSRLDIAQNGVINPRGFLSLNTTRMTISSVPC
ncbi:hypothetical protein QBC35DRAFT_454378 [Podospora australis]|uniref:DUF4360 domain-containing protein n=1 Tax=Podospora australis TaxID=1536484 RepID=A0AAN7AFG2_9PEZI|nr:hypothetical protein QBC35DRAFT_454378 [Podospora australis]